MKKRILIGVIVLAVFTVAILAVWQTVKRRNKPPQVISDLVSGKYKNIEVYKKILLPKNYMINYQNAKLLLQQ